MLPAKFGSIWPSSFREDFFNIRQSEKRIALGGHICWPNGTKWRFFIEDLAEMLPVKFTLIWASSFREEDLLNISQSEKKNCSWQPYLLAKRNETKKLYRGPYIDASCQVWLHLAKQFQRRRFFNISQSEKRIALGGHVYWPNGTNWRSFIEDLT